MRLSVVTRRFETPLLIMPKPLSHPKYTAGELFCGAGGLSRGFHDLDFEPKFANDIWPLALHNFLMNFDEAYAATGGEGPGNILSLPGSVEDISISDILPKITGSGKRRSFAVGELDVLLGGPPCQGFSVNSHVRSAKDPRNQTRTGHMTPDHEFNRSDF